MRPVTKLLVASVSIDELIIRDPKQFFACFGYGSLVNRKTLSDEIVAILPARLNGWRRRWQARDEKNVPVIGDKPIALLSVTRDVTCSLDGLLFVERSKNLAALAKRERFYQPHAITLDDLTINANYAKRLAELDIHVYGVPESEADKSPGYLLRSYLDVVMQGYLIEFGQIGLQRFMDTTHWADLDIIEDRDAPIYPRHQSLGDGQAQLFDKLIG